MLTKVIIALAAGVVVSFIATVLSVRRRESFSLPFGSWFIIILVNLLLVFSWAKWVVIPFDLGYVLLCLFFPMEGLYHGDDVYDDEFDDEFED